LNILRVSAGKCLFMPQSNGEQNLRNPLPHGALGLPSNRRMPKPTETTARSVHALSHNYATKSPLVTMGRPNSSPKLPFPSTISTPSNTPIPRPTSLTTPNGIRINSAVLPQYIFRTDRQRQADRPTDRESDALIMLNFVGIVKEEEKQERTRIAAVGLFLVTDNQSMTR